MSYTAPAIEHQMHMTADLDAIRYSLKKKAPSPAN